ncbi:MAG: zf-TFIIB domain-containing protein [Betaproteobacteria bacterium]|nr:zf-TFIIB domain-containing protein [Betaproteobacteria bacterium]
MTETPVVCSSCANPMRTAAFARKLGGELSIDICLACKLIWFDQFESMQLAPGGLLELFRLIHAHQGDAVHPDSNRLRCPRCRAPLVLTHDLQRNTRFVYYRCETGHGRLTAFYQFLREKNFVRNLNAGEVARLKADIKQLRCSGCGAPINLETDGACSFCKAPIAILDANAVQTALQGLAAAEAQHREVTAGLASVENMIAALETQRRANGVRRSEPMHWTGHDGAPDLVGLGIGLVATGFSA